MAAIKKSSKAGKKTSIKTEAKLAVKKTKDTISTKKEDALSAACFSVTGETSGAELLPKEIFGKEINLDIIAQAVRVYRANQREGSASTKTRGQVEGSTRKIYKQKGTGRARHGGIRAPIFVGGGIVFGPQSRDYSKHFPQSMKSLALTSAFSYQQKEKQIYVITNSNEAKPKTTLAVKGLKQMNVSNPTLFIVHDVHSPYIRAIKNIEGVTYVTASQVTTYDVVTHKSIGITKEAIDVLKKRLS